MAIQAAAIVHDGGETGDMLLVRVLTRLRQQGFKLRGLITWRGKDPEGKLPMLIRDIHTDILYPISQELGSGSKSCSLDPGALLNASHVLQKALHDAPDLVLINRFGGMEACGRGFASDLLNLLMADIPVLTVVSQSYQEKWLEFTGHEGRLLPLDSEIIFDWALSTRYQAAHA